MSCPAIITLPCAKRGDTWDGFSVSLTSDGTSFADELAAVAMSFTLAGATTPALELTSAAGHITIDDAAAWSFTVEPRVLAIAAGVYSWEIQTTDSAATPRVKTYLAGTLKITTDGTP